MPKIISNTITTYIAIQFAKAIKNKFTEWEAFKLGLIDAKGNKIKKPVTPVEKDALSPLMNLIRKIKRVILKVVPDSPIINFVLAASLLKEEVEPNSHVEVWNELIHSLTQNELEFLQEMIKELENLDVIETTTATDVPSLPIPLGTPQTRHNGCPCFDVSPELFFDIKMNDREKFARLEKYYGDTNVAQYCRCQSNKGKTIYLKNTEVEMVRKLTVK